MIKKGQGLSMNTIIIALITLLVLIVIISIFTSRSQSFAQDLSECEKSGGECTFRRACDGAVVPAECEDIPLSKKVGSWTTVSLGDDPVCCIGGIE